MRSHVMNNIEVVYLGNNITIFLEKKNSAIALTKWKTMRIKSYARLIPTLRYSEYQVYHKVHFYAPILKAFTKIKGYL